ncbi:hypothetical protein ACK3SF_04125 [Candidatus Nanosalina sp. VS9-1]|uniref:hypothetical protein n=1 Tax=Candidatus Nanosalina sp. VS9-1 TaxID=3388566 RepID=UPI0039DFA651
MAEKYLDKQEHSKDVKKLRLSSEERENAENLVKRINDGEISSPDDFLDEWEELEFERPDNSEEVQEYINLDKIKGAAMSDRLSIRRLKQKLNILADDDWIVDEQDNFEAPHLVKHPRKEVYHVGVDGHHRVMAFKAIGIGEIKVRYDI